MSASENPIWRRLPVIVDANVMNDMPWAKVRAAGYSRELKLNAPIQITHVSFSERPEYLYVTGDSAHSVHAFWFAEGGGTAEFDLVDGQLMHVDCAGCNFSISGSELIFSPHRSGGNRKNLGGRSDIPRNSEELFIAALNGYRPELAH